MCIFNPDRSAYSREGHGATRAHDNRTGPGSGSREGEESDGWTVHPRRGTERAGDEGHGDFGCGRNVVVKLSLSDQRWILCPT